VKRGFALCAGLLRNTESHVALTSATVPDLRSKYSLNRVIFYAELPLWNKEGSCTMSLWKAVV
jgi:hypothetical protein